MTPIDSEAKQEEQISSAVGAIGRSATRGLAWSLGGTILCRFGGLLLGLVLARLLAPSDFGLYAVALAATQFVMMIKDLGVIGATMHWRGPLDKMTPTASTLALVSATAIYAVFFIGAPAFAQLAGNPDAAPIVRLLTAVILVEAITAVRSGVLMREFRQDRVVLANISGLTANALIAISLAVGGIGAMSVAAGQVAGAVVAGVVLAVSARVPWRYGWDRSVAVWLLKYGMPLAAGLALEAVVLNADFVVIGRLLDVQQLGYYLLAFNISSWALTTITMSVRYVSVAGFARLSEFDAAVLSASTQRSVLRLYQVAVPIGVLTATLSVPLIALLYGSEWLPAAPVLRYLAILTVVRVMISLALDILMGAGATRSMVVINGVWAVVVIPALIVGVEQFGITGAALAHAIVGLAVATPLSILALRQLGIRLAPIVPELVRPTLAGATVAVVVLLICELIAGPPILELAIAGTVGIVVYFLLALPAADRDSCLRVARRLTNRTAVSADDSPVVEQASIGETT